MINSKGEKGCESPVCLWVTRWFLISLAVVFQGARSPPSVKVFFYPLFARLCYFCLIGELRRECVLGIYHELGGSEGVDAVVP